MDREVLLVPSKRCLDEFFGGVDNSFELHKFRKHGLRERDFKSLNSFASSGFLELRNVCEVLTPRQREVFDLACKRGYYRVPKHVTLGDIANELEVGESTVRKHIRLAERQLMPLLNDIMKLF